MTIGRFVRILHAMLVAAVPFMPVAVASEPWDAVAGTPENAVVLSDGAVLPEHSVLMPDASAHFDDVGTLEATVIPLPEPGLPEAVPLAVAPAADDDTTFHATVGDLPESHAFAECDLGSCPPPGVLDQPGLFQWWSDRKQACWTVRADAILMWRNAPRNRPLFTSFAPATDTVGPQALNANSLESDMLTAPRVSLLRNDGCGNAVEATYLYAGNFYSQRVLPSVRDGYVTAAPGLYGNAWGPAGTALTSVSATLLGNLQSAELNGRTAVFANRGQFLAGFRWLQWNEQLLMTDSFSSPPPPEPIANTGSDRYSTQCFNNLFGGQIGLDAVVLTTSRNVRVDGLVKAGAYYNSATQQSAYSYVSDAPFSFASQFRNGSPAACSFVGEVGLTAVIPLRSNLDFRCGYFGLWIDGLAQPSGQLSTQTLTQTPPPRGTLDTTGGVVLQGLSLGLEGRW